MTVAWIGNRDAQVPSAIEHVAALLVQSRCPVITVDADADTARAALALARRAGAVCDHLTDGLAHEVTLFTGTGGVFLSPGEALRRADLVLVAGALPAAAGAFLETLAQTSPDLGGERPRRMFALHADGLPDGIAKVTQAISVKDASLPVAVAVFRAAVAGRGTGVEIAGADAFAAAAAGAKFIAVICSGHGCDTLTLEMLQGLVGDFNANTRASMLVWPASENGWGSTLVSTWNAGFPLPVSFLGGEAKHDPARFNARRLIESGEVDVWLHAGPLPEGVTGPAERIVISNAASAVGGASVTIAVAEPGEGHDAVMFSARAGTFLARAAGSKDNLPSAAEILRLIAGKLPETEAVPC
ncbi:tungsten formylmethanofuran dehydrogenase [bacterium SGD-2]|jgi:Formylmethanofuran dehydrogenase subunit B|nr:tungsten formylmethanofuran dehydrogenase [bacterium SGD-2]